LRAHYTRHRREQRRGAHFVHWNVRVEFELSLPRPAVFCPHVCAILRVRRLERLQRLPSRLATCMPDTGDKTAWRDLLRRGFCYLQPDHLFAVTLLPIANSGVGSAVALTLASPPPTCCLFFRPSRLCSALPTLAPSPTADCASLVALSQNTGHFTAFLRACLLLPYKTHYNLGY